MTAEDSTGDLTHLNERGEAHMVDVGSKPVTVREAEARGAVIMSAESLERVRLNSAAKGDVLAVARIAGIMAAKRTDELIPLCHSLPMTGIEIRFELDHSGPRVEISALARTEARTGVEMEALTAVSVAALTIYDMLKAADRSMTITDIRLTYKSGGRSGTFRRD